MVETPSTPLRVAVAAFCELLALTFMLPTGEALYRGEPLTVRMGIFLAVGALSAVLGAVSPYIGGRFCATLASVASDLRWWLALLLALFVVSRPSQTRVGDNKGEDGRRAG